MRRALLLFVSCILFAACESSVNVEATANVPAQYSSVLVTVKEVWINESATAGPEDTTWLKFPLEETQTLDLVETTSGDLAELASALDVPQGTYRQMRLFLADRSESLTSSANSAGATFNNEVSFFDESGVENTVPLELANAAQGIGIEMELTVSAPVDAVLAAQLSGAGSTTSLGTGQSMGQSTPLTGTPTGTSPFSPTNPLTDPTLPSNPVDPIDSSDDTPATTPGSGTETVTATAQVVFDAARDLVAFRFSDTNGFLLNPSLNAYDPENVGNIRGELDLSALIVNTGTRRPDIQVTAETLNEDSTRRVVVASAPVDANGTFALFPLPLDSESANSTTYDLVIHGPGVQTVIIREVPVTDGSASSASDIVISGIALTPSDSYAVNLDSANAAIPRGSRVAFYQTLPDDNAPFVVELRSIDPTSGQFATEQRLSAAPTVAFATFASTFTFTAATPQEGASRYSVAALASLYGEGALSETPVQPPASPVDTALFTVAAPAVPSTAAAGTISATASVATPGKYDRGTLLVTRDGSIVTAAPLEGALSQSSGAISVPDVPAGAGSTAFDKGLYYIEAWVWNSADPQNTFARQAGGSAVDLRSSATANAAVTIE